MGGLGRFPVDLFGILPRLRGLSWSFRLCSIFVHILNKWMQMEQMGTEGCSPGSRKNSKHGKIER